ncbi:fibronectin type III domain-containing protein, partial [bacterium]|nr:fibronectin type III domain-containing protein [bacterium]
MKQWLCLVVCVCALAAPVFAQTVIYQDNFDDYAEAQVPNGWTKFANTGHVVDPDLEAAIWNAANYDGWTAFGDGYDGERLQHADDPKSYHPLATWKSAPGADFSQVGSGNRLLIADTVIPAGGSQIDSWLISDPFDVSAYNYAVFSFESFFLGNQDQQGAFYYRTDDGDWKRVLHLDDERYRDEGRYYGPYSFAFDVQDAQSIQFYFVMYGTWSWFWALDKFELVGYNDVPPGPAKPQAVSPQGEVDFGNVTLQSSPYAGDGEHAFSQWQIRLADGTYGEMENEGWDPEHIAWVQSDPILDTSMQPNIYAEEDASFIQYDLAGDQTQFTVRRELLRPGKSYYWRVRYFNNENVAGPWSDEVMFSVGDLDGFELLSEDFDDASEGEAPQGWEFVGTDFEGFGDGEFGPIQLTRPRYRWADFTAGDDANQVNVAGDGRHGGFKGQVSWVAGWAHDMSDNGYLTPVLDFSNATTGWVIFDSCFKGGGTAYIDVVIDDGEPTNVYSFGAFSGGNGVRSSVETVSLPPDVAGKSNVRIQFRTNKSSESWTFDNVRIVASSDATFIEQPVAQSPLGTASYTPGFTTLKTSAYNDPDGEAHTTSRWEVARANVGFERPIVDELVSEGDLTSYQIQNLAPGNEYIFRVKYLTDSGRESPWSLPGHFMVTVDGGELLLSENFDNQEGQTNPEGWSQVNNNEEGGYPEFNGWSFLTLEFFESYQQSRENSPYLTGRIADADSDEYDQSGNGFNSELISPVINPGGEKVLLAFDSLYRHYPSQIAELNVSLDGGASFQNVFTWDSSVFGESELAPEPVIIEIPGSETTNQLQIMWKLYGNEGDSGTISLNDWWWAIDNVHAFTYPAQEPAAPDTPMAQVPNSEQVSSEIPLVLTASSFSEPSGGNHSQSQWQVARASVGFERPIIDETVSDQLTAYSVDTRLVPGHDYIWRVKYSSDAGFDSEWSEPATFGVLPPAEAQLLLSEDFNNQSGQDAPSGWTHVNNNDPDGYPEFNGWSYLTLDFFESYGQGRGGSPYLEGIVADADSDEYEQDGVGAFNSELISPTLNPGGKGLLVIYDQIYQHYSGQIGELNYSLDNGATWTNLIQRS